MTAAELLSRLHDIHPPPEPGWWPPAPGVYFLFFFVLALLWGARSVLKRRKAERLYKNAKRELEAIRQELNNGGESGQLALRLSGWLKRVSLPAFPDECVAGMTGRPWLEFLDQCTGGQEFTRGSGKILASKVYGKSTFTLDEETIALCERWLLAIKPRLIVEGRKRC